MKLSKICTILILFLQILNLCLSINLKLNKRIKKTNSKGSNAFMSKLEYAHERYIEYLTFAKKRYSKNKEVYSKIKTVIHDLERWYESQWKFYSKLTESYSRISQIRGDYDNFWASIESAYDYYIEPLDYLEEIKIATLKIRKCLSYFNGKDCSGYKEVTDVLKPNELERFPKKSKNENKGFFSNLFGKKK